MEEIQARLERINPQLSIGRRRRVISAGLSKTNDDFERTLRHRALRRTLLPEERGRQCVDKLKAALTRAEYMVLKDGRAIAFRESAAGYERIPPEAWSERSGHSWKEARFFVIVGDLPGCLRGEDQTNPDKAGEADQVGYDDLGVGEPIPRAEKKRGRPPGAGSYQAADAPLVVYRAPKRTGAPRPNLESNCRSQTRTTETQIGLNLRCWMREVRRNVRKIINDSR